MSAADPALELRGVHVPFGGRPGLADIHLTIEIGERFVLVGASGAGKSSLLRAIAGTVTPTQGAMRIGGQPTDGRTPLQRDLVLLEQRPLLFPHLSVGRNVAFPLEVRRVGREETRRRVADALDAVRLPDLASRMPNTLSGGQAHRVALARAVVAGPRLLLLDEPLTSLDPSLREDMRRAIVEVGERYGTTLLMVTHDLREAGRVGQRVGVLTHGRLAQVDPPELLFRRPRSLEVARFIGWRNELPAHVDADGTVRVAGRAVRTSHDAGDLGLGPGWAVLCFGAHGARIRPHDRDGVPVRVSAVRHDPHGVTVEYRLDTGHARAPEDVDPEPPAPSAPGRVAGGEIAVSAEEAPAVGAAASLELVPSRALLFPVPDPATASRAP